MNFSQTIVGLATGWAVDKYGPRLTVGIGGILVCVGLIMSSYASSVTQLYIFLGVMVGCGINASYNPYIVTLARWFVKQRGFTQGILVAGVGTGMMTMAPLATKLIINYGWRSTFMIISIIGLVIFSISAFLVRKNPQDKGLKPYGMNSSDKVETAGHAAAALTSRKDFTLREAIKTRDLWLIVGVTLTFMLTIFMVMTHLVNYAKDMGMPPTNAALLMTIIGGVSIFGKISTGSLADKIGTKKIMFTCAIMLACLLLWLATTMNARMFYIFAVVYGVAYGGMATMMYVLIPENFGVTHMGKIFGFVGFGGAVGGVIGPWLAGYVFDTTGSYSVAFIIGAGSTIVMAVLILLIGKTRSPELSHG